MAHSDKNEVAVLGGGCFWCTEAIFVGLNGILSATPGYAGGSTKDPTYDEVSAGNTGHVEATRIVFDPDVITFKDLLTVFFATHDPTTRDRQGNDVGPQYRSVIFYTSEAQREQAEEYRKVVQHSFSSPIVTDIRPFEVFYEAENYYKRYYKTHKDAPYCRAVIDPKLEKLQKQFAGLLKKNAK